jgi:hypothetical protein
MASQRVFANNREFVVGRSIRITWAFIRENYGQLELRYRKVDWQVLKIAKAIPPRLS